MSSISELKAELYEAQSNLLYMRRVKRGSSMVNYNDQLTKVTRLTAELNRAIKEEAG